MCGKGYITAEAYTVHVHSGHSCINQIVKILLSRSSINCPKLKGDGPVGVDEGRRVWSELTSSPDQALESLLGEASGSPSRER